MGAGRASSFKTAYLAKDDVLAIEELGWLKGDEELTAVGVWS